MQGSSRRAPGGVHRRSARVPRGAGGGGWRELPPRWESVHGVQLRASAPGSDEAIRHVVHLLVSDAGVGCSMKTCYTCAHGAPASMSGAICFGCHDLSTGENTRWQPAPTSSRGGRFAPVGEEGVEVEVADAACSAGGCGL